MQDADKISSGMAEFQIINDCQQLRSILDQIQVRNNLDKAEWYVQRKDYQKYNWKKIFLQMRKCQAWKISLIYNQHSEIIKQMGNVYFANLKYLFLDGNNIDNVEPLGFMNGRCLQFLILSQNHISRINCMHKLSTECLDKISFAQNPLKEINHLTKSRLNSDKIYSLTLKFESNQIPIHEDMSILTKLACKSIGFLNILTSKRIRQPKVQAMLELRFPQIQIPPYQQ